MIQAPENYLLVEIEKKFQDEDGGLFIDTTWTPEEYATLEGNVISAPLRTASDNYRTIVGNVKEGDHVFFSYGVIFDYTLQPEDDTPVYKNLLIYEGREYWRVDIGEVYCRIAADGTREMVTDNVLIEPTDEDAGTVIAAPPNSGLYAQEQVCFETRFVQRYNVFGGIHFIIPTRKVLAKLN